jgi:hypothetical protein
VFSDGCSPPNFIAFSAVMLLYSLDTTPLYLVLFFIKFTLTDAPTGKGIILNNIVSAPVVGGVGVGVTGVVFCDAFLEQEIFIKTNAQRIVIVAFMAILYLTDRIV